MMSRVGIFSRERVAFSELWAETRLLAGALGAAVGSRLGNFKEEPLPNPHCLTILSYMRTVTSRDLAHRPKEIRKLLVAGETLQWTSHGVPVALILPVEASTPKPDWVGRARAAGAVNQSPSSVAESIYADRD